MPMMARVIRAVGMVAVMRFRLRIGGEHTRSQKRAQRNQDLTVHLPLRVLVHAINGNAKAKAMFQPFRKGLKRDDVLKSAIGL
jgi:hypothetical protein